MKLYTFASSPNCWKVLAVARELAIPMEMIPVDLFNGDFALGPFIHLASGDCELDLSPFRNLLAWRERMNAREKRFRSRPSNTGHGNEQRAFDSSNRVFGAQGS